MRAFPIPHKDSICMVRSKVEGISKTSTGPCTRIVPCSRVRHNVEGISKPSNGSCTKIVLEVG
jgi:hypothetical protein